METKLNELKTRLQEIYDLRRAADVLYWDLSTHMPPGGAEARSRQLGVLERLAHEKATDAAIGHLLDDLRSYGEALPYDSLDASLLRLVRREFDQKTRIPAAFVAEFAEHRGASYQTWTNARPANDFAATVPFLEKMLDYSRQYAEFFPHDHIADPHIDQTDYGMKAADIRRVFGELREALVPLVQAITAQEPADDSCVKQYFSPQQQLAFGFEIAKQFGYNTNEGRQDLTAHPFAVKLANTDVRITTRVKEHDITEALFSALHEAGHALYEQGCASELDGTPLDSGTSAGVHESQSRLWENIVGRSRGFWEHYYGALQQAFPDQLGSVSLDTFYRAINKVQRSLIRTDADEVTYNLHVMIRFDLELDLLEGKLAIRDLPEAWNARYASDLGMTPPDDRDGILQDVHWYDGFIGGAFQGYTLGNILSVQFYDAALKAHPHIPDEIAQGRFETLHGWLVENIYQHGSKFTANELVERVTGGSLSIEPYMTYLRTKYGALYTL